MRAFNRIILLFIVLSSLIFACSTFPCLTDTYASFSDTKHMDVNLTAAVWDAETSFVEIPDLILPVNGENINGTTFDTRENPKVAITGKNSVCEKSQSDESSAYGSMSTYSAAGNYTVNLTVSNPTPATGSGMDSPASATASEQTAAIFSAVNSSPNVTISYTPPSVQLMYLSKNITELNWNCRDGDNSTLSGPTDQSSPTNTCSSTGNYSINLAVNDSNSTNSKFTKTTVSKKEVSPVGNFSSNATISCDTEQNMTNRSAAENYTVRLIVKNSQYKNSTTNRTVLEQTVLPAANFSTNVSEGFYPLSVKFNDSAGNTVNNSSGTDSNATTIISGSSTKVVSVVNSSTSITGYTPVPVQFTNLSKNETRLEWDPENDENIDSIEDAPVYGYPAPENETVSPITTIEAGQITKTSEIFEDKNSLNDSGNGNSSSDMKT